MPGVLCNDLFSQTILEGLSLGIVVTYFDVDLVLKAFVITTAVFIGLTAYTMQSKYDFSTWGARYYIIMENIYIHTTTCHRWLFLQL